MSDQVRLRTDVVLSCIIGKMPPLPEYFKAIDGMTLTKQDMAALAMANPSSPYSFKDLEAPMAPSQMVIPDHKDYLAGHTKINTSYVTDWPLAADDNRFGENSPFGSNSNCCPLLHGMQWGDPHYVQHLFDFHTHSGEQHAETERRNKHDSENAKIFGNPQKSVKAMRDHSLTASGMEEEEWEQTKREQLTNNFGLLPYLFGLEWNSEEENDRFVETLAKLSQTEDMDSPDARKLMNDCQGKCGITWDRALRNWRDRFTPLNAWWQRPSDRSGPTSSGEDMFHSPYTEDEPGHNYHWWEPFQYWGGVGRDSASLNSMFSQTYPRIFNEGWLGSFLTDAVPVEGPHMLSGSHFPVSSNTTPEHAHAHTSSSMPEGVDFERRRANWSHASRHHHLSPDQIEGQGSRMTIPPSAFNFSRLGQAIMSTSDLNKPRAGLSREEHVNSNDDYYDIHNRHAGNTDDALASVMMDMATEVSSQFGPQHLKAAGGDMNANTLARGNIQQLAQAAEYALLRGNPHSHSYSIPDYSSGMKSMKRGSFGPVNPMSESVAAPSHNSGNTDAWGHPMDATLAWKWDRDANKVVFDVKDTPFKTLQRTAHEGLVSAVDPSWRNKKVMPSNTSAGIFTSNDSTMGFPTLTYDLAKSNDDYEPTGVFNSTIEPAHVVRDLDDMDTLKGFSGDWVVQKKPKGDHVLVKKVGKSIEPMSLSGKVKKSLKDTIEGDVVLDGFVKGDLLTVVDLLLHKGDDLHMEPLEDRINILKTLYTTTDNVHYPSPNSCVNTDEEGLTKAIANLDREDLLIRDATSTFIKGRDVHPKWVLYAQTDISKAAILPPLPEISVKGADIILEYPAIHRPIIVKTEVDEGGRYVDSYDGPDYLVKNAQIQFDIWSPVAAFHIEPDDDTLRHIPSFNVKPFIRKSIDKAPEVITESEFDDDKSVSDIMRHARKAITSDDKALSTKEILACVDGLTEKLLENYSGEYGLERTEDNRWTVNEAIDDDIAEKFAFPRMNRASSDGGAWSGMQADITMPTGPTEITDDENTTFGDPKQDQMEVDPSTIFRPLHMVVNTEDGEAVLDVQEDKAVVRFPLKEKNHEEEENDVLPASRSDKAL